MWNSFCSTYLPPRSLWDPLNSQERKGPDIRVVFISPLYQTLITFICIHWCFKCSCDVMQVCAGAVVLGVASVIKVHSFSYQASRAHTEHLFVSAHQCIPLIPLPWMKISWLPERGHFLQYSQPEKRKRGEGEAEFFARRMLKFTLELLITRTHDIGFVIQAW